MLIYDKAYVDIKNKYVLPLTEYAVPYKSLRKNNIKEILVSKFISVEKRNEKSFVFSFEQDILLKGLLGDIQLFYMRYLLQKRDADKVNNAALSPNWNIVTYYYKAFFAASLLLRLMHRGNIFLDLNLKKELEALVSYNLGYPVSIDSNQFYELVLEDKKYTLKLQTGNSNTHELVWEKMDLVIDEMLLLSRNDSPEKNMLTAIKKVNNQLSKTYPSKLRNKVNYQPQYGLEAVERNIYPINTNVSWVDFLLKYESISWSDENSVINALFCYTKYIEQFCENLVSEYFIVKGNANGVLKKFNEFTGEVQRIEDIVYNV